MNDFYFCRRRNVLQMSSGVDHSGPIVGHLAVSLLVAWVACYFCIWKGIRWTGKVWWISSLKACDKRCFKTLYEINNSIRTVLIHHCRTLYAINTRTVAKQVNWKGNLEQKITAVYIYTAMNVVHLIITKALSRTITTVQLQERAISPITRGRRLATLASFENLAFVTCCT